MKYKNDRCRPLILASGSLFAAIASLSTPAHAQAKAQSGDTLLEDIVIVGRPDVAQIGSFRGARVLDMPLTVAVIDREVLSQQQASGLGDALRNTAGVTFSQVSPAVTTNAAIRGIGVENRTNYRLNGGLPVVNLIDMPVEAYERVEVLKGVSSLYYGFTTPAGIVNMVAKRTSYDPVTTVELTGNSDGALGGHVDLGRMNDAGTLGFRLNLVAGDPRYGVDRTQGQRRAAILALDAKPTDTINLKLDGQFIHKEITEPSIFQLTAVNGVITLPPILDKDRNFSSPWMLNSATETNVAAHGDWRFLENWQLVLEAGVSEVERDRHLGLIRNTDVATGDATLRVASSAGTMYRNINMRGDVTGAFNTGPLTHQLTLGVTKNIRKGGNGTTVSTNYAYNIYTRPIVSPVNLPVRYIPNFGSITDVGYYVFDKVSYGGVLDVLGGVRRTNYKNLQTTAASYQVSVTSLSGGVVVKPTRQLSLYASYIEGLEEGGVASALVNNPGAILQPNKSTQKEAGVKWTPLPGTIATISYFDIERASSYVNGANFFVQDGRTLYRGVEASVSGHVVDSVSVILSGMYLNAKQRDAADPTVIGKAPENTPEWTGSVYVNYEPGFLPGISINGGAFYTDKRAVNNANQAFIPAYTVFNVGGAYRTEIAGTPVTLRVSGENITNKDYYAATGANLAAYGLPRLVKFTLQTAL